MKQVFKDKIINIDNNIEDNKFLIKKLNWEKNISNNDFEIIFLSDLLEEKKNLEMLEKSKTKPATYSNVYSPKDELEIFEKIFNSAIENNKKVHIV
jgi:predicted nicotinamide N-methyase